MTKALTLHQPWAQLVAVGAKTIETRSWPAPKSMIGARLLIHAGKVLEPWTDEKQALAQYLFEPDQPGVWKVPMVPPLPRGAVVASCTLADCVPTEDWPKWHAHALRERFGGDAWSDAESNAALVESEFGDFSPGRWAWILEDVKPTTERCPNCWGEGIRIPWACPVCEGAGKRDPIPARGKQGLWEWAP